MTEDWRVQEEQRQQLQDIRFFRVIETLLRCHGAKTQIRPGDVFPSLRETGDTEDDLNLDEIRAFIGHVAQHGKQGGV